LKNQESAKISQALQSRQGSAGKERSKSIKNRVKGKRGDLEKKPSDDKRDEREKMPNWRAQEGDHRLAEREAGTTGRHDMGSHEVARIALIGARDSPKTDKGPRQSDIAVQKGVVCNQPGVKGGKTGRESETRRQSQ